MSNLYDLFGQEAVSYTHLDVYKRQYAASLVYKNKNIILKIA